MYLAAFVTKLNCLLNSFMMNPPQWEQYRQWLVGKTIQNLYFTAQDGPYDYMPGIPPAYYFSSVLELNDGAMLRLGPGFLVPWNNEEPLHRLHHKNWDLPSTLVFQGQRITAISGERDAELVIVLENGVRISHTQDYGDQLLIRGPQHEERVDREREEQRARSEAFLRNRKSWWKRIKSLLG